MSTSPSSSAKQAQKALGGRLREIRKDAGLSGRALAAATGQHFTRVSKIENGVQPPSETERTAVSSAGFWIFDRSLAALETPTASVEVTQPQEIELYAKMFGHLQAAASYGPAARALVIKAIGELLPRRGHEPHSA